MADLRVIPLSKLIGKRKQMARDKEKAETVQKQEKAVFEAKKRTSERKQ
jgi:hypothetical protein